jgi:hypothetical protein
MALSDILPKTLCAPAGSVRDLSVSFGVDLWLIMGDYLSEFLTKNRVAARDKSGRL